MKVLILSRDDRWDGGVVNYVNVLVKTLSQQIEFKRLFIGKRFHRQAPFIEFLSPVLDCIRLIKRIKKETFHVVHLNPSLNSKSIFRDGFFLLGLRMIGYKHVLVCWHGWNEKLANRIKNK